MDALAERAHVTDGLGRLVYLELGAQHRDPQRATFSITKSTPPNK